MPQKKKEPKLRWKSNPPSKWWHKLMGIKVPVLQEWSETQNKYVDVPQA